MKTVSWRSGWLSALVALACLSLVGGGAILAYVDKEKSRDLHAWETLLGVVADGRMQSVGQWVDSQAQVVKELAENASVRFYVSQLAAASGNDGAAVDAAQLGYLRNLLESTAGRSGFSVASGQATIPANIDQASDSGFIIVDATGRKVAETTGFRPGKRLDAGLQRAIEQGKPEVQDFYENERGEIVLAFIAPIFPVSLTDSKAQAIGAIAGVKRARDELFPLFARRSTLSASGEAILLRKEGDFVDIVSPLADGTAPLRKRIPQANAALAEVQAWAKPGAFLSAADHAGREVFAVSRAFRQAPWVLLEKIDAAEALRESDGHQRFLITALTLAALLVAASLAVAWWHGATVKERSAAGALREKADELERQSALLQGVMDGSPDLLFIMEGERLWYCNKAFAATVGETAANLRGKTLSSVMGPAAAKVLELQVQESLGNSQPVSRMYEDGQGGLAGSQYFTTVPIQISQESGLVLCLGRDMSAERAEQSKRQALMKHLVGALSSIVDLHDPYCAGHSMRTAQVAIALARELSLDERTQAALEMAARLANVGKIFLPRELLTKTEALDAAEQALVHSHVQHTLGLLKGIDFEGPVLDIIAQKSEHLDGSGYPAGLSEADLLLEGRILAVANAFVAMVSARAYRAGVPVQESLDKLLGDAGKKYDRHVVAALFHVAENRPDWISWSLPGAAEQPLV